MALIFNGFINDGEEAYDYESFINALRDLAMERKGTVDVHFSLHHEGYDDEKTFSPKLRIDFADNCYIHHIAPTEDGETYGDFEQLGIPNYPK